MGTMTLRLGYLAGAPTENSGLGSTSFGAVIAPGHIATTYAWSDSPPTRLRTSLVRSSAQNFCKISGQSHDRREHTARRYGGRRRDGLQLIQVANAGTSREIDGRET
jgi:hypothetical protein